MYQVTVPQGVSPGGQFNANINGQLHLITCPKNVYPGQSITIQVPDQQKPTVQTSLATPSSGYYYPQNPNNPTTTDAIFNDLSGRGNNSIDLSQFQTALSKLGFHRFQLSTCKLLMSMFDTDRSYRLDKGEYTKVMDYLMRWQQCFQAYDSDRSGSIDFKELKTAVTTFGYRFSDGFFQKLFSKYDSDKSGSVSFDEFVHLFCELHILTESFKKKDTQRSGVATFQYEEFLDACLAIHS